MRAVVFDRYTRRDGLRLRELPVPTPAEGELLVEIAATGLNPFDWHQYTGEPWILRASSGWRVTEPRVVGADIAGVVSAVGEGVEGFAAGDRVFGSIGMGGLATHAASSARRFSRIADAVSFVDAAAAPMASLTALQAIRDAGRLAPGERVLVWGASGGVGHLAVQIARILDAGRVDAVASARHTGFLRALGADRVVDRAAGITAVDGPYDVVIDTVATQSVRRLQPVLAPGARVVTVGSLSRGRLAGPATALVGRALAGRVHRVAATGVFATVSASDLGLIAGWLADGRLRPAVQEIAPLSRFDHALATLEAGHVQGKIVVDVRS